MARKILVAGNWKLNGSRRLVDDIVPAVMDRMSDLHCDVGIFPPALFVAEVARQAADSGLIIGSQDVSPHASGAHTGEIAADMIAEVGGRAALCGHSERREDHGESNELVARKVSAALQAGIIPVLCVGESLAERQAGQMEAVVGKQVDAVIAAIDGQDASSLIVAYEPVWAIGTGQTASPEQAQQAHAFIRSKFAAADAILASGMRILYGGSVKGANAAELFQMDDIDGGLIGGASLTATDFIAICDAVSG